MRNFIKSSYATIKTENPGFPFLIREAEGVPAKMTARYGALLNLHHNWMSKLPTCLPCMSRQLPTGDDMQLKTLRCIK